MLVYRVVYNDGDQQDWLHHNVASLRQCYNVNNIDPCEEITKQIPLGTRYETTSGVVVEVVGHTVSAQNEQFISFDVHDDTNESTERLNLSLLKFQIAVKRKINTSSETECDSGKVGGAAIEWPVSHDRIDPACSVGNGMKYKVCNGMHLLRKGHNYDYSGCEKLPYVEGPQDVRPGVRMGRYDPANIYSYTHWDPSQCLLCELCGVDKDDNLGKQTIFLDVQTCICRFS